MVPDLVPGLSEPHELVTHQRAQQRGDECEGGQGGQPPGHRDQQQQDRSGKGAVGVPGADVAPAEGDVTEQVDRDPGIQRDQWETGERIGEVVVLGVGDVLQDLLQPRAMKMIDTTIGKCR